MATTRLEKRITRPQFEKDSRAVTLIVRVKHEGQWRRFPASYGGNGRVKPGYAMIDGRPVQFNNPAYEIRIIEDRKPRYMAAGRDATHAEAERKRIELQSAAVEIAEAAGVKVLEIEERKTIRQAAEDFCKDAHARKVFEAEAQARQVMPEFMKNCAKAYVDEITRQDILRFHVALRKRGLSDRTIANKHARLKSVLRFNGLDVKAVMPPEPKYDETLPTIYTPEQVRQILAAAEGKMRIAILMALKLGLREGELAHAEFADIDWHGSTFRVKSKPAFDHFIKDGEERDIPIATDLLKELKTWRDKRSEDKRNGLVIPTANDTPDYKLLANLKGIVRRGRLECGRCEPCQNGKWGCSEWTLHRFRRTFLTRLLQGGVDLRTVQHYAGHSDLESTLRYLRPAEGNEAQAKINAIQW